MTKVSLLDTCRIGVLWYGEKSGERPGINTLLKLKQRFTAVEWVVLENAIGIESPGQDVLRHAGEWVTSFPTNEESKFFEYITHLVVFELKPGYLTPEVWVNRQLPTAVLPKP